MEDADRKIDATNRGEATTTTTVTSSVPQKKKEITKTQTTSNSIANKNEQKQSKIIVPSPSTSGTIKKENGSNNTTVSNRSGLATAEMNGNGDLKTGIKKEGEAK